MYRSVQMLYSTLLAYTVATRWDSKVGCQKPSSPWGPGFGTDRNLPPRNPTRRLYLNFFFACGAIFHILPRNKGYTSQAPTHRRRTRKFLFFSQGHNPGWCIENRCRGGQYYNLDQGFRKFWMKMAAPFSDRAHFSTNIYVVGINIVPSLLSHLDLIWTWLLCR